MDLWLVGRSAEQLQATADAIASAGGSGAVHCVPMDLSDTSALARLVEQVGAQHPHLFTLINNAGVMYPEPMLSADPARWYEMFSINLFSPMEGSRAAVLQMRKHGQPGHLINVSSIAGFQDNLGAYSVCKAAVNHLGHTLRKELEGDDIRVTTIVPGGFATNLSRGFPPETFARIQEATAKLNLDVTGPDMQKVMGDPEHIASVVEFVLSQPIEVNLEQIIIRPAVQLELS
jgi:NAD(P)-dependent dehydrogenase (short-subunit alcohol dehydrogenase family)